uniref:Uncharacterized protein n=1 Tax=Anguilla anguilla TaxID=7936 RepID=A0A0E9QMD5_ANGAN
MESPGKSISMRMIKNVLFSGWSSWQR